MQVVYVRLYEWVLGFILSPCPQRHLRRCNGGMVSVYSLPSLDAQARHRPRHHWVQVAKNATLPRDVSAGLPLGHIGSPLPSVAHAGDGGEVATEAEADLPDAGHWGF